MKNAVNIIPLIHYSELTEPNWRERIFEQFVLVSLWSLEQKQEQVGVIHGNTSQEVRDFLNKQLNLSISRTEVQQILNSLEKKNWLRKYNKRYLLNEIIKSRFENEQQLIAQQEQELKIYFKTILKEYSKQHNICHNIANDSDNIWRGFMEDFFIPLVRDFGAYIHHFLANPKDNLSSWHLYLEQWLTKCCINTECQILVKNAIHSFLEAQVDSANTINAFFKRYIRAYFLLIAVGLPKKVIHVVTNNLQQKRVQFTIFADTNFLFSVLGLHDNPSNDAALDLIDLIQEASQYIEIELAVSYLTLDEARRSLDKVIDELGRNPYPPNIAAALLKDNMVSGLRKRFFEYIVTRGQPLSADEFFHPYRYLDQIVQEKGIIIYDNTKLVQPFNRYKEDATIQSDIDAQLEYEQRYKERAKSRPQIEHDILLWYMVRDLRSKYILNFRDPSILQARYWIATIDYRFINLDRYLTRYRQEMFPITMHPVQLIQILRFFVPLSEPFDKALIKMIKLPLHHESFDIHEEKIALKIARLITLYSNHGELSEESIIRILTNQSLRSKIDDIEIDEEEIYKSIDSILVKELSRVQIEKKELVVYLHNEKFQKEKMHKSLRELEKQLKKRQEIIESMRSELHSLKRSFKYHKYQAKRKEIISYIVKRLYIPFLIVLFFSILLIWLGNLAINALSDTILKFLSNIKVPLVEDNKLTIIQGFRLIIIAIVLYGAQSTLRNYYREKINRHRRHVYNVWIYRLVMNKDLKQLILYLSRFFKVLEKRNKD